MTAALSCGTMWPAAEIGAVFWRWSMPEDKRTTVYNTLREIIENNIESVSPNYVAVIDALNLIQSLGLSDDSDLFQKIKEVLPPEFLLPEEEEREQFVIHGFR